jgi:hypothetical protein
MRDFLLDMDVDTLIMPDKSILFFSCVDAYVEQHGGPLRGSSLTALVISRGLISVPKERVLA